MLGVAMLFVLTLAGCSVVGAVKNAAHKIEGNRATVDSFTGKLQS